MVYVEWYRIFFCHKNNYTKIVNHDNYKLSPIQQLCTKMTNFDNYVPKLLKFGQFFSSFFGDGNGNNSSQNNDDVCFFSFFFVMSLLQCSPIASSMCFELTSNTKVFFMDTMLLWKRIRHYGNGK